MSFKATLLQFCVPHVPHLSSSVAFYICLCKLLLIAVLVLSTGRIFNCLLNQVCFPLYSTSIKLAGDFVAGVFYSFTASEVRSPIGEKFSRQQTHFVYDLESHKLTWSFNVRSWIMFLSHLLSCFQWTLMEYFLSLRNWKSLSLVLFFRAIRALVFSSRSWSMEKIILALSSAFLSPEFLNSLWSDSWSVFSKMLPTAFLREAVSK